MHRGEDIFEMQKNAYSKGQLSKEHTEKKREHVSHTIPFNFASVSVITSRLKITSFSSPPMIIN
jgi:hypothetical protein